MDSLTAIACDRPRVQRAAARIAFRCRIELEELTSEAVLILLERNAARGHRPPPETGFQVVYVVLEAARRLTGHRHFWQPKMLPYHEVTVRGTWGPTELAYLPPVSEPLEDPDAETRRHRDEWARLSVRERQERIIESRRALCCSI